MNFTGALLQLQIAPAQSRHHHFTVVVMEVVVHFTSTPLVLVQLTSALVDCAVL